MDSNGLLGLLKLVLHLKIEIEVEGWGGYSLPNVSVNPSINTFFKKYRDDEKNTAYWNIEFICFL